VIHLVAAALRSAAGRMDRALLLQQGKLVDGLHWLHSRI
jgi:hypothetical protein